MQTGTLDVSTAVKKMKAIRFKERKAAEQREKTRLFDLLIKGEILLVDDADTRLYHHFKTMDHFNASCRERGLHKVAC